MEIDYLAELLAAVKDAERLLIVPHNDPDPDAIASAVAMHYLLKSCSGLDSDIVYKGIIGRAENRALVRYLNHPLHLLKNADLDEATHIILIDTQPGAGNNPWQLGQPLNIVIDHHPLQPKTIKATFSDVRPGLGAASTIILDYLQAAEISLPTSLITALFYGIKTDTRGLSRGATATDLVAYFYLQSRIDVESLAEIERAQVPPAYFKSFAIALEATQLHGEAAISYIGEMDYPDLAAEMADLLSRLDGIGWVICMGTYRGTLFMAVRTPGYRDGAGRFVQAVVGKDGTAGGHGMMAGGQIPLKGQNPTELVTQLQQRILQYLNIPLDITPQSLV